MRWQDLTAMAALEAVVYPDDAWSAATWWSELAERPRRDYWVLTTSPAGPGPAPVLLGYAGLDLAGESADVMTVAVDPRRRGEGHGVHLMEQLRTRAARAGAGALVLEVREDNTAARRLYDRCGYTQIHRRRGYYQPGGVDALVLRREVST